MKLIPFSRVAVVAFFAAESVWAADVVTLKNRRELFVDDFILQKAVGVENRICVPLPAGTALKLDQPWEGRWGAYVSVISDGQKFMMYYRGGFGASKNEDITCYAESTDGKNWVRPNIGRFEVRGSKDNNVVMPLGEPTWATHNFSVFYDARPEVPADERFKAVGGGAGNNPKLKYSGLTRGLYRFVSADGKEWRRLPGEPLFTDWALDSQNILTWLPEENCFAIYLRTWTGDKKGVKFDYKSVRTIARSVSKDFANWSEPERMTFDRGPIEDLYTNTTQAYFRAPQILISMPFRFVPNRQVLDEATLKKYDIEKSMWKGVSDAVLMSSRGGTRFDRKFLESFVRPGIDPASWAARSNMPAYGIIQTGPNEMSFFIVRGYSSNQTRIERMSLRLDGFSSLHAGSTEGFALTKPVKIVGRRLSLNLSTSANGYVKVVILDENGAEIPGFGATDARELVGDTIDLTAAWKGSPDLAALKDRVVQLKFLLCDADLYSFAVLNE
jgi:hypothetical protein